jgi:hypothetical protein
VRCLFSPIEYVAEPVSRGDEVEEVEKDVYFEHCAEIIAEEMADCEVESKLCVCSNSEPEFRETVCARA